MDEHKLIVGMDLGNELTRICYSDEENISSMTAAEDSSLTIPSLLWRGSGTGWLAGTEAEQAAQNGEGERITSFLNGDPQETVYQTEGETLRRADLAEIFIRQTLSWLESRVENGHVQYVTVTLPEIVSGTVQALRQIGDALGFANGSFAVLSHERSFAIQALTQPRDVWMHGTGLFEYGDSGLIYREMRVEWSRKPLSVQVTDPVEYGVVQEEEDADARDRTFADIVEKIAAPGKISSFFLFGRNFEEAVHNNEMHLSLQKLGAGRRRVFIGDNLYARGAFCSSLFLRDPGRRPEVLIRDSDMTEQEICVRTLHRGTLHNTVLVPAGTAWYEDTGQHEIIAGSGDRLVLLVRDPKSSRQRQVILQLDGIPVRPERTTRLTVRMRCSAPGQCSVTASDEGFGELYASSGKTWSVDIDMTAQPDENEQPAGDIAIECMKTAENAVFAMPVSGIRLHTPEELCWYIYHNTFAITPDIIGDDFYDWLDKITGSQEMTNAIRAYRQADRPFEDIIRLILRSVDYLTVAEIAEVMDRLAQAGKSNKAELARLAADNYCRSGLYMAALRCYQSLLCKLDGEFDPLTSRSMKAAVWHNAGVAFLKLHNTKSAVQCMAASYDLDPDSRMLQDYLQVLYLDGDQEKIEEIAGENAMSDEQVGEILKPLVSAAGAYRDSQRFKALDSGLKLKYNSMDEYRAFCQEYLEEQKTRYTIS